MIVQGARHQSRCCRTPGLPILVNLEASSLRGQVVNQIDERYENSERPDLVLHREERLEHRALEVCWFQRHPFCQR